MSIELNLRLHCTFSYARQMPVKKQANEYVLSSGRGGGTIGKIAAVRVLAVTRLLPGASPARMNTSIYENVNAIIGRLINCCQMATYCGHSNFATAYGVDTNQRPANLNGRRFAI